MGRAHLSAAYGIDDAPERRSPCPEPPRYIDAPFDLDVDAPDAVYEAFLTGEEADHHPGFPIAARENAASPIESDDGSSDATTQPSTRVPSPVRHDRGQRADSPVDRGVRVMELLEPLTNARVAASPAIQAAMANGVTEVGPLVRRLTSILRPHIVTALAPFMAELPEVRFLGQMYERSLILDLLGSSSVTGRPTGFLANEILAALDSVGPPAYMSQERRVERMQFGDDEMESFSRRDLAAPPIIVRGPLEPAIRTAPPHTRIPEDSRVNRAVSPPLTGRASPSLRYGPTYNPSSRPLRPIALSMDLDDDDDARSTASSSFSSGPFSLRPGTPTFVPRIFRARDGAQRQSPSDLSLHAAFLPSAHYLATEALR